MAWYNNFGDFAGDIGHGVEDFLGGNGQPGGPMRPGMPQQGLPNTTLPGGDGNPFGGPTSPFGSPGGPGSSPLDTRSQIMRRVLGDINTPGGPAAALATPATQGSDTPGTSPASPTGDQPGILGRIFSGIENHKGALSLLGQAAGGVEAIRENQQQRKLQQEQLDLARGYYNLQAQRQKAEHDALAQMYAQNKYRGAQPAPPAGTPMQQSVMQRLGY